MDIDEIIGRLQSMVNHGSLVFNVDPIREAIPYLRKAKDYEGWTDAPVCQRCEGNICAYLPDDRDENQEARLFCDSCGQEYMMSAFYRVKEQL